MNDQMETEELITFGKRLKHARQELKMLEKDFALRLDVSDTFLRELEAGKISPGYELLRKLFTTYKINLHFLLNGEGESFVNKSTITLNSVTGKNGSKLSSDALIRLESESREAEADLKIEDVANSRMTAPKDI